MSSFKFNTESTRPLPDATQMRIAIVTTEWNCEITDRLVESAVRTLRDNGVDASNITIEYVPGSFELIFGAAPLVSAKRHDAIIAIGCVIRGETPHFDYICQGTTQGLASLNAQAEIPVVYGVLTVNNIEQALDRLGGKAGDKGAEFALTAIKMVAYSCQFKKKL